MRFKGALSKISPITVAVKKIGISKSYCGCFPVIKNRIEWVKVYHTCSGQVVNKVLAV